MTVYFGDFFAKQGKKIARKVSKAYAKFAKATNPQHVSDVMAALDLQSWVDIVDEVARQLDDVIDEALASAFSQLRVTDPQLVNQVSELSLAYAKERAAELVGMKWIDGELVENPDARWAITETTRDDIRQLIADAFENGSSPKQLAQKIEDSASFSAARAEMISRTEVAMAHVATTLDVAKATGATLKRVVLSNNHDIDDVCDDAAAAGAVAMDYEFDTGVQFVPLHPNCTCLLIALKPEEVDAQTS